VGTVIEYQFLLPGGSVVQVKCVLCVPVSQMAVSYDALAVVKTINEGEIILASLPVASTLVESHC
jgi:hypothetical protein